MRMRRADLLLLTLILFLGFALRIFRIEIQSIWWDEGISLNLATSTWGQIMADRVRNIHPPGYFLLLKSWVSLVGVSPFAARYSSALVSLVQITAVYATALRFFGKKGRNAALLAALLVATSPLSIIYAQEIRVYSFLPLVAFALLGLTVRLLRPDAGWRVWVGFGAAIWFGMHLHYIVAFLVLYCGAWLLVVFIHAGRWRDVRRLFGTATAVLLASLPWFVPVVINQLSANVQTRGGTFLTDPVPYSFLLPQIWLFHLTGLAGALQFDGLIWWGTAVFLLFCLLLVAGIWGWGTQIGGNTDRDVGTLIRKNETSQLSNRPTSQLPHHPTLTWFLLWFVPLAFGLYLWSIRSFSHPRYVLMFALNLLPLLGWLMVRPLPQLGAVARQVYRAGGVGLITAVFATSFIALNLYYFDPRVEKDDMRGVAHYLERVAQPTDLIIIPDTDHSFRFEYDGSTPIVMPNLAERDTLDARFVQWTGEATAIYVVDYKRGARDWQRFVPFALNNGGVLVAQTEFEDLLLHQYEFDAPYVSPEPAERNLPVQIDGGMTLLASWVEPSGNSTGEISVPLRWRIAAPPPERVRGTLRLLDENGRILTQQTVDLLDPLGRPPDVWLTDQDVTTVHTLPIPEGVPPLRYTVTLELFTQNEVGAVRTVPFLTPNPQASIVLGDTNLIVTEHRAVNQPQILPRLTSPAPVHPALSLLGYRVDRDRLLAGQTLFVDLLWQAERAEMPPLPLEVLLVGADGAETAVFPSTLLQQYPTNEWQQGQSVWDTVAVAVPTELEGQFTVEARVGEITAVLDTIQVEPTNLLFTQPNFDMLIDQQLGTFARLVGMDGGDSGEEGVYLRLVWQAVAETAVSYKLFVHLLDENGQIVGQYDAIPQAGQRPTNGWVEGEYLVETVLVPFNESGFSGEYQIVVGLYDPNTAVRLQTAQGEDIIRLP